MKYILPILSLIMAVGCGSKKIPNGNGSVIGDSNGILSVVETNSALGYKTYTHTEVYCDTLVIHDTIWITKDIK